MNPEIQNYVENLFKGYEQTAELEDFKEEIMMNMADQISDLVKTGISSEDAFTQVVAQLGDITEIADDISRQKRNEIIGNMYINHRVKVSNKHALGYVLAGGILLFGIIVALLTYSTTHVIFHSVSSAIPFIVISGAAFVFLGLTQETMTNYPMSWKRALIYTLAFGSILFGVMIAATQYFMSMQNWTGMLGTLIPFVIPQAALIGYLILTEKSRHKPWVLEEQKRIEERYATKYSDPTFAAKRGLLSGAVWISSFGGFAFIWMVFGLKYAFFVFVIAIVLEMFIEFWVHSKAEKAKD